LPGFPVNITVANGGCALTTLEAALTAWIAFHAELGVDIESYLLPPATEDEV